MNRAYMAAALAVPAIATGLTAESAAQAAVTAAVALWFGMAAWCAIFWNRDDDASEPVERESEYGLHENHISLAAWREQAAASAERSRCRRNGGDF